MASSPESSDEELRLLSEEIWKNPEVALEEYKAHQLLSDFLENKGFLVERKFCGVDTAFRARSASYVTICIHVIKV